MGGQDKAQESKAKELKQRLRSRRDKTLSEENKKAQRLVRRLHNTKWAVLMCMSRLESYGFVTLTLSPKCCFMVFVATVPTKPVMNNARGKYAIALWIEN